MEVLMFSTHVPQQGRLGPWLPLQRRRGNGATKLSVTAFRPGRIGKKEIAPIRGEIEWRERFADDADRNKIFNCGMVDILLQLNAPIPRVRFHGEGTDGADLRVVVQFRDLDDAA